MAKKKTVEVEPVEHSPKFELVKSYYDAGLWKKRLSGTQSSRAGSQQPSMKRSQARSMSSLDVDRELASLSIPELIERLSRLTENYSAAVERITCEILIRSMQNAE